LVLSRLPPREKGKVSNSRSIMRCVFTALRMTFFGVVALCRLVGRYKRFGVAYRIHNQG
jgi:hypothetical protein